MSDWKVEYEEDRSTWDEWWTVTDGSKSFKCDSEPDAKWLCEILNDE